LSGNVYNCTSRYKRQLHGVTLVRKVEKSTERTNATDAGFPDRSSKRRKGRKEGGSRNSEKKEGEILLRTMLWLM
jgi:hypothetical protein